MVWDRRVYVLQITPKSYLKNCSRFSSSMNHYAQITNQSIFSLVKISVFYFKGRSLAKIVWRTLVSRSQTAFLLLCWVGKKRVWWMQYSYFVLAIPNFWGFYYTAFDWPVFLTQHKRRKAIWLCKTRIIQHVFCHCILFAGHLLVQKKICKKKKQDRVPNSTAWLLQNKIYWGMKPAWRHHAVPVEILWVRGTISY